MKVLLPQYRFNHMTCIEITMLILLVYKRCVTIKKPVGTGWDRESIPVQNSILKRTIMTMLK